MLKVRLIPVLLLKNGLLVRSELFKIHQIIGNPINEVKRFNEWNVDELIYIDISKSDNYDLRRDDLKMQEVKQPLDILTEVSKTCFMPLTWGGRIRDLDGIKARIKRGADKVTLNTAAYRTPELITEGAKLFGSQAIVVSMDVFQHEDGHYEAMIEGGKTPTGKDPKEWVRELEDRGAGEILIQSTQRDGTGRGYDTDLIHQVCKNTTIPVIACSGVGDYRQYSAGVEAGASAVAAANIWHFKELSDRGGKKALASAGVNVRI